MYVKRIPKTIQEKLKARERALSFSSQSTFGQEKDDGSLDIKDIGTRSVFVRMCSNKLNVPNILISGGELSSVGDTKFGVEFGLQQNGDNLYNSAIDQSGKDYGKRPIPGIKSIEVGYKGSYKAIRQATINWVVGSIADLERLTPYFLTVGKTVALDWGWINPRSTSFSDMFNGEVPFITFNNGKFEVNQDIFTNPFSKIQKAGGDYDALAGQISNFEMQLRQDGGFDCTTTITAIGSFLFQKPIDKPSNQITIEDVGTDLSKKKVAFDTDNIINTLINLKGILLTTVFGLDESKIGEAGKYLYKKKTDIKGKHIHFGGMGNKFGFALDNIANPQVLWMSKKEKAEIFVKWGYFEDQILNRYISVKGGKDNDIKMTMRSIDTVLNKDGLPRSIENADMERISLGQELLDNDGSGEQSNQTSLYTVKRGDSLSAIARKLSVNLDTLVEDNLPILTQDLELFAGTDKGSDNEDNLFGVDDGGNGVYFEGQFIPRENYSFLNLQPQTFLVVSQEQLVVESAVGDSESVDAFLDEVTAFRGLKDLNKTGKFLKTPTLIKNKKNLLKPKDPFKFFSVELFPTENNAALSGNAKFINFIKAITKIKDSQFTKPGDENSGRLRYMWVNIEEIQSAFGIKYSDEATKPDKINPPKTLENGIKNLLIQLNRNFYDFWNFELAVDTYDPSNIKVFDKKMVDLSTDSIVYTKHKQNSHKVDKLGIYKFPSFKAGSIVKNQNLSFKIPDALSLTIMFGSNKEEKKNQSTSLHNNPDIMKLFALDKDKKGEGKVWGDRYLDKIKPSNVPSNQKNRLINIGSQNTNHNSLIVEDEGITIQPQIWWDEWTGENKPKESKKDENGYAMAIKRFEIINDDIVLLKEDTKYKFSDLEISEGDSSSEVAKELEKLKYKKPGAVLEVDNARTSKYFYNFTKKGDLFIKPEIEKILRNRLSGGVAVDKVDTIKVDTIIPAELSLEVDGIGGLQPGDICQTDYIQPKYNVNFYKDDKEFGPFTYFQIVGINQKVDSTGWITEVETKMRINHIPDVHNLQVSTSETIQEEVEAKDDPVVRIDKVEAEPDYPENKILPDDDDDEITNVKLDQLDFEDFPKWDVPLGPPPQRGLTNIPTKAGTFKVGSFEEFVDTENLRANTSNQILLPRISSGLGDLVQKGSTYNNLQLKKNFELIPPANRPYVRVPTDDEDENIDDDIAALGPQEPLKGDDYSNWDEEPESVTAPPKDESDLPESMPVTIIDEKAEEIKSKDIRTKKSAPRGVLRILSTYTGDYWQNDLYLYNPPHKPEWRPIFEWPDGSRKNYDVEKDSDGNVTGKAVKTIRAAKDFDVRQQYWDDNIEAPNEGGKSKLNHEGAYNPRKTFKKSNTKRDSDNEYLSGEFGDFYASLGF